VAGCLGFHGRPVDRPEPERAENRSPEAMPPREWPMAKARFALLFGERFTKAMA
jgi:hypothetical protein